MTEREKIAEIMAKALANIVLNHREALDGLMADYGYKTNQLSEDEIIDFIGQKIREREALGEAIFSLIRVKLRDYNNMGGWMEAISGLIVGGMQGVQGLIDVTSDSGKKVRETQAQAALEAARAQQMAAQAALAQASKKSSAPLVAGIVGGVGLVGLGLFLYFKYGRKKSKTA